MEGDEPGKPHPIFKAFAWAGHFGSAYSSIAAVVAVGSAVGGYLQHIGWTAILTLLLLDVVALAVVYPVGRAIYESKTPVRDHALALAILGCGVLALSGSNIIYIAWRTPQQTTGPSTPGAFDRFLWPPLSPDEALALKISLRDLEKPLSVRILCSLSECSDLAQSLKRVFDAINWAPRMDNGGPWELESGVVVLKRNYQDTRIEDALNKSTRNRLQASTKPLLVDSTALAIAIGRKPQD